MSFAAVLNVPTLLTILDESCEIGKDQLFV